MSDQRASGGPVVVNGIVRYFSPSSLTTGDPESFGGCARRWHFKYVAGKKEPQTAAQKAGVETHAEIERYLKTGEKAFSTLTLAGARYIPKPHPEHLIEHPISTDGFSVVGVPIVGYIDLVRPGPLYFDEEGRPCKDPDGTVEVLDWKTTSDIGRNAKSAHEMSRTIQMVTYARFVAQILGAQFARVSHVYFQTRGRAIAKKVTCRLPVIEVNSRWQKVEGVARKLLDVAKIDPLESSKVEGNARSCDAYGGCPHRSYCRVGGGSSLESMFGAGASRLLPQEKKQEEEKDMALPEGIKAQMEALKAKETAAATARAPEAPKVDPRFAAAWEAIEKAGKGTPSLIGALAQMRGAVLGVEVTRGAALSGSGLIGTIQVGTVDDLVEMAKELAPGFSVDSGGGAIMPASVAETPAVEATVDLSLLPPDAPASKPELAAKPVEGWSPASLLVAPREEAAAPVATTSDEAPKKRGRPKKSETPIANDTPRSAPTAEGLELFVDCIPTGQFADLSAYVESLCERLATTEDVVDIRCAPNDSVFAFGKWKGYLAALAKKEPPPAGTYVIMSRDERAQVVAEALKAQCSVFAKGVLS